MIGVVAAGGSGTRMAPITKFVNKQLIPCGKDGKLMIDYPIEHMAQLGFDDLHIVTGCAHAGQISEYVGDGLRYGFKRVDYRIQPTAAGIADILIRVRHVVQKEQCGVLLILGDNYFEKAVSLLGVFQNSFNAHCWEYDVGDPKAAARFGQVVYDDHGKAVDLVEKPPTPIHSKIVSGIYYFPADVHQMLDKLSPSKRGELEITELLAVYAKLNRLSVNQIEGQWSDLGTWESWSTFMADQLK